jgi:uncharacterized protein (DUF169 family)
MALAAAMASGLVMSTDCIGHRVCRDLSEDELYVAAPGKDLARIAQERDTIREANSKLFDYHHARLRELETLESRLRPG